MAKEMKPEEARLALIAMVKKVDDPLLNATLPSLRTEPPIQRDNLTCFGPWRCDLKEKTFVATFHAEPIFAEFSGTFRTQEQTDAWVATIEREVRN